MRTAVIKTFKALFDGNNKSLECDTTRISNELKINIITDRVNTQNRKWYEKYSLIRSNENIERVKKIFEIYPNEENLKSAKKIESAKSNKSSKTID